MRKFRKTLTVVNKIRDNNSELYRKNPKYIEIILSRIDIISNLS